MHNLIKDNVNYYIQEKVLNTAKINILLNKMDTNLWHDIFNIISVRVLNIVYNSKSLLMLHEIDHYVKNKTIPKSIQNDVLKKLKGVI